MTKPLISIVIPTFNRDADLVRLLESIKESDYPNELIEVIIVDNASNPALKSLTKKVIPNVNIIVPGENVYSQGARRRGSDAAHGTYIFLVDDDNTFNKDCLTQLVDVLDNDKNLGAVAPLMMRGNSSSIWSAGGCVSRFGTTRYLYSGQNILHVNLPPLIKDLDFFPNAWMIRKEVLDVAPIDDKTFPHNWAETDFCLQILAAGYKLATVTSAIDRHHINYTGFITRLSVEKTYDQAKSRLLFRRRHMPGFGNWIKFWTLVFPISSGVYAWHIFKLSDSRIKMILAYMRGTIDGLFTSITKPKVLNKT